MNSSAMSDSLLATLLASGKLSGIPPSSFNNQSNDETSGASLLERVLQLTGGYPSLPNAQLLRLQNMSSNQAPSLAASSAAMATPSGYGLSQSEILQALQVDQNHAQLAAIAEKLRHHGQGTSAPFFNRGSSMEKFLSRDQDSINLSLGLGSDLQSGSPLFSNAAGSVGQLSPAMGSFRTSTLSPPSSVGRGNFSQDAKDLALNKVRLMGVDINQSLGLTPSSHKDGSLHMDLFKRKDEFGHVKDGSDLSESNDDENLSRKKMRLSRQQSMYLEQKFFNQESLSAAQKSQVAKELGLLPRQVEVWFQNRRARRRLKQAETDCEILRKSCKALQEENLRLHAELRSLQKAGEPEASQEMILAGEAQLAYQLGTLKDEQNQP